MRERIDRLRTRIDSLSLRERGILFLTLVAVIVFLWQSVLMDPLEARRRKALDRINTVQQEVQANDKALAALIAARTADPDAQQRRRRDELQAQIDELDERLAATVSGLVEPRQMARVLEDVLTRRTDLRLVKMESLPSMPLVEPSADGTAPGAYRHGLRMELEGSYLATLDYLRALQDIEQALFWDSVEIDMKQYPKARVTITVHTIGLREGWIGV